MPRKPIAPKISDKSAEFYPQIFSNLNAGATYVLDAFPVLYRRTLHDLRGTFTCSELMLMVDVFNSTFLTSHISGQHLDIQVADGIALDALDKKWEIDGPALNAKIAALPIFSAACLEIWANGFWYSEASQNKDLGGDDFRAWLAPLLGEEAAK